jgi:hypothetical protein
MQAVILTGDTYTQLLEDIRAVIRHELPHTGATPQAAPADTGRTPRTAKQIAEKFDVCVATVWEWCRQGKFGSHKMGGRTYFFEDEVLAALNTQQRTHKKSR